MASPVPVNGMPSKPGIWTCFGQPSPIEILDGVVFVYTWADSLDTCRVWQPCSKSKHWQWVREFVPGDPRIPRPTKSSPPLPDAEHRHPDGCPKDGLWVYRCSRGEFEFRLVKDRRYTLNLHGECAVDIRSYHHASFVKHVGQPSDFAPAEPKPPAIEPCPWCGRSPRLIGDTNFVKCDGCLAMGPSWDTGGAQWNRVARAARGA